MTQKTATGRRRYRAQPRLFRKPMLVLQIEYHMAAHTTIGDVGAGHIDTIPHPQQTWWQDAALEDLTELGA